MIVEKFEPKLTIEQQFENREVLDFYGGRVEIVDIRPEGQKTEIPVVMASGWGGTPDLYKDDILALAEAQRRVISVNAPHGIGFKMEELDVKDIPDAELRKISALMNVLEAKGLDKIDAIGHSQGCIDIVLAATLYPEKFRNLILINPGGMIGKDNPVRLAVDFSKDLVKQVIESIRDQRISSPLFRAGREFFWSAVSDPAKAFLEVLAISNIQIHDLLKDLKQKSVGIAIVHNIDDRVFPMDRIQEIAKIDQLDGFYSVKGTHGEFYLRGKQSIKLAEHALTALEKKHIEKNKSI